MRNILASAILCLASASVVWAQEPAAQAPVATFKASVNLVPVSLVVRDKRGHLVTTLSQADFQVFDNGAPARIVNFDVAKQTPVSVAVLLDTSGSMRMGPRLPLAGDALARLLGELHDGRDEVGLFTFDDTLRENQAFTIHPAALGVGTSGIMPFGTTSLYDAIAVTARELGERPASRRAIVVLTDGLDTSSALAPSQVSAIASAIDVPVFVIETVTATDRAQYVARTTRSSGGISELEALAEWTGGQLLFATSPEEALATARQILDDLRHTYVLAIESAPSAEWRRIDVRLKNRSLSVQTRSGYFGQ